MPELLKRFTVVRSADEEIYCLAYGSNLSVDRMKARCPDAEVFGTSEIPGYRLLFKKSQTGSYATIEQDANCSVPVLVYRISEEDEMLLDRCEGYPKYYYKREFFLPVRNLKGRRLRNRRTCYAYIMHENRFLGEPSREYYGLLDKGYERWGFNKEWLTRALEDTLGYNAAGKWLEKYEKENGFHE